MTICRFVRFGRERRELSSQQCSRPCGAWARVGHRADSGARCRLPVSLSGRTKPDGNACGTDLERDDWQFSMWEMPAQYVSWNSGRWQTVKWQRAKGEGRGGFILLALWEHLAVCAARCGRHDPSHTPSPRPTPSVVGAINDGRHHTGFSTAPLT